MKFAHQLEILLEELNYPIVPADTRVEYIPKTEFTQSRNSSKDQSNQYQNQNSSSSNSSSGDKAWAKKRFESWMNEQARRGEERIEQFGQRVGAKIDQHVRQGEDILKYGPQKFKTKLKNSIRDKAKANSLKVRLNAPETYELPNKYDKYLERGLLALGAGSAGYFLSKIID